MLNILLRLFSLPVFAGFATGMSPVVFLQHAAQPGFQFLYPVNKKNIARQMNSFRVLGQPIFSENLDRKKTHFNF